MAQRPQHDGGPGTPLDGRLDLDALDLGHDLVSLDVIGEDRPTFRETLLDWLEPTGIVPVVRRHRTAFVAGTVAVALVLAGGTVWRATRPEPLPERPHAFARAAGADPTAALVLDVESGAPVGVRQTLTVTTAEPTGITVRALGLAGPGLRHDPAAVVTTIVQSGTDAPLTLSALISCTDPADTTAVLGAGSGAYVAELERTSPSGETRVDPVPIVGSATLADLVRRACLQSAADHDLAVRALTATAVPGVVALDLDVEIANTSARPWDGLRIAAAAQPVVVNDGRAVSLEPGATSHLHARLWPEDCSDPAAALRDGILLATDIGPSGLPPADGVTVPSVRLRVPDPLVQDAQRRAIAVCGTDVPVGTVTRARLREGAQGPSAGTVEADLAVTTPGAGLVEVDHLGDGVVTGDVFAFGSPVRSVDGIAVVRVQWRMPTCEAVLAHGLPRVHVVLASEVRRPYLVTLRGDALRPVLVRLCGDEVAALA